MSSNTFWASAPSVLNDRSEFKYGERLLREAWESAEKDSVPQTCVQFVGHVLDFDFAEAAANEMFLISASRDSDLLTQWRHYSGIDGFAIGLDMAEPMAPVWQPGIDSPDGEPPSTPIYDDSGDIGSGQLLYTPSRPWSRPLVEPSWHEVIYDAPEQRSLIADVLRDLIQTTPGDPSTDKPDEERWDQTAVVARGLVLSALTKLKDPAFRDERELRFVTSKAYLGDAELYRADAGRLIPYLLVSSTKAESRWVAEKAGRLPIIGVRCGPSVSEATQTTVARMLSSMDYDVETWPSAITSAL